MEVAIEEDDNNSRGDSRDGNVPAPLIAEAKIVRAFLPFLWLQTVLGSSRISIREGLAVSKSTLSRCYSALHTVLCLYSVYGFHTNIDLGDYNTGLALTFTTYMLLMSFMSGYVCVCKHRSTLDLFKSFAKFDVLTDLVENDDYEMCLNEKAHVFVVSSLLTLSIVFIIAIVSLVEDNMNLLYYYINKGAEFKLDLQLLNCCCMVEQAAQRVGMLRAGLEQSLGQAGVMEQTDGGWMSILLPQTKSLHCQVSLDAMLPAYVIIRRIVRRINESFKHMILLYVILLLYPACTVTFIAESIAIEGKDPLLAVADIGFYLLKEIFIFFLLSVACERLVLQESRLVCFLSEVSTDSRHLNPAIRSLARRTVQVITSSPLSVSLWAGCDMRATFIPVLLSLLTNCLLLRLQFPSEK